MFTLLFLKDALFKINNYAPHNRLIAYFLAQNDLIIGLLALILFFEFIRWLRIKDR